MMKKYILLLFAALLLCIFLVVLCNGGEDVPVPDEILIYRDGSVQTVTQEDAVFSQICALIRIPNDSVQETAIDPDAVCEIKETLAVEYCYNETRKIGDRTYSRLLFSLSGWTENSVILYQDGEYRSGTYESRISAKKLTTLLDTLQK